MEIAKEDLQAIFDLALGSLDFSSGFWDTDETDSARRIAVLLGVDPMVATPYTFKTKYRHEFEAANFAYGPCKWCGLTAGVYPHQDREQ